MKYIKTYENFNYSPLNEEFLGLGKKLREIYQQSKDAVNKVISNMSDEEKSEAMDYLADKGLTPEVAKEAAQKLDLEKPEPSPEVTQELADVVGEEVEQTTESVVNEGLMDTIKDRLIRFIGLPGLTTFIGWLTSIVLRAVAPGWASQPAWIQQLHDALPHGLHGPLALIGVFATFILFVITMAKIFQPNVK